MSMTAEERRKLTVAACLHHSHSLVSPGPCAGCIDIALEAHAAEAVKAALWECDGCGFAFSREHSNADGTYSCPVCEGAVARP